MLKASIEKIVSGGQTGADRGALDAAIALGMAHGGWCPKGRRAKDGRIPPRYELTEAPSDDYCQRTEWNVRDSDGTVVFTLDRLATGGTLETIRFAERFEKPLLHIAAEASGRDVGAILRDFVARHGIRVLNVAGSREDAEPGIAAWVKCALEAAFSGDESTGATASPFRSS